MAVSGEICPRRNCRCCAREEHRRAWEEAGKDAEGPILIWVGSAFGLPILLLFLAVLAFYGDVSFARAERVLLPGNAYFWFGVGIAGSLALILGGFWRIRERKAEKLQKAREQVM